MNGAVLGNPIDTILPIILFTIVILLVSWLFGDWWCSLEDNLNERLKEARKDE